MVLLDYSKQQERHVLGGPFLARNAGFIGVGVIVTIKDVNFFIWMEDIGRVINPYTDFYLVSGEKRFEGLYIIFFDQQIAHSLTGKGIFVECIKTLCQSLSEKKIERTGGVFYHPRGDIVLWEKNRMAQTKITVNSNGSLRIEGDFEIVDMQGRGYGLQGREVVSLCRCGRSGNKPFCDGSHKGGFDHLAQAFDLPPRKG